MWRRPLNNVVSTTTVHRELGKMLDKTYSSVELDDEQMYDGDDLKKFI